MAGVQTTFAMNTDVAQRDMRVLLQRLTESEAALRRATDRAGQLERRLTDAGQRGGASIRGLASSLVSLAGGWLSVNSAMSAANAAFERRLALEKQAVASAAAAQAAQRALVPFQTSAQERDRFAAAASGFGIMPERAARIQALAYDAGLDYAGAVQALHVERTGLSPEDVIGALKKYGASFGMGGDVRGTLSQLLAAGRFEDISAAVQAGALPAASIGTQGPEFLAIMKLLAESGIKDPERGAKGLVSLTDLLSTPSFKVGEGRRAKQVPLEGAGIQQRLANLMQIAPDELERAGINVKLVADLILNNAAQLDGLEQAIRAEADSAATFNLLENQFLRDPAFRQGERQRAIAAGAEIGRVRRGQRPPASTGEEFRAELSRLLEDESWLTYTASAFAAAESWLGGDGTGPERARGRSPYLGYQRIWDWLTADRGGPSIGEALHRQNAARDLSPQTQLRPFFGAPESGNGMRDAERVIRGFQDATRAIYRFLPPAPMLATPNGRGNQ